MENAKGKVEKITICAVVRRADGTVEDLGEICEMKQPDKNVLAKIKDKIMNGGN